jgi:hypothetical protein
MGDLGDRAGFGSEVVEQQGGIVTRSEIVEALGPTGAFLNSIGIPAGVLLLILYMFWQASATLHETVVVPIVESHTEYLYQTSATLRSLGETQCRQAETLQEIAAGQRDIHEAISRMGSVQSGTRPPR